MLVFECRGSYEEGSHEDRHEEHEEDDDEDIEDI